MNIELVRLGYKILMVFTIVDGRYTVKEGSFLVKYIEKHLGSINDFDLDVQNSELLSIPTGAHYEMCMGFTDRFNQQATEEDKIDLIYYAFEIINITEPMTAKEEELFREVSDHLGIDVSDMLTATSGEDLQ